ncbi:MAG: SBBP repeat-containing protein [Actinomycetota bacterium]
MVRKSRSGRLRRVTATAIAVGALTGSWVVVSTASAASTPVATAIVSGPREITVSWSDANASAGAVAFERSVNATAGFTEVARKRIRGGQTNGSYVDDALNVGTTYYYRVRAIANDGTPSAYSNVAHATTSGTTPPTTSAPPTTVKSTTTTRPPTTTTTRPPTTTSTTRPSTTTTTTTSPPSGGGVYRWSRAFGGSTFGDDVTIRDVAAAPDGDAIVVGDFSGTVNFGSGARTASGARDIFAARFSAAGALDWVRQYGGAASDFASAVAVGPGGEAYIGGGFAGTVNFGGHVISSPTPNRTGMVFKLASDGTVPWARVVGSATGGSVEAVATDGARVVATGGWRNGNPSNGNRTEVLLAAFSAASGAIIVAPRGEAGTGTAVGFGIALASDGHATIAGHFEERATVGGRSLTSVGPSDVFVAQYAPTGAGVWANRYGGGGADRAASVAAAPNGDLVVVGTFAGTVAFGGPAPLVAAGQPDIFAVRLTTTGAHIWSRRFGHGASFASDTVQDVAIDQSGNVLLTGEAYPYPGEPIDFGTGPLSSNGGASGDPYLVKLNTDGETVWAKLFPSRVGTIAGMNHGDAVATAPGGDVIFAGRFVRDIDVAGHIHSNPSAMPGGSGDGLVARFGP